jgi:hypothetical protein
MAFGLRLVRHFFLSFFLSFFLQAAEFKQLTTIGEIADKLKLEVKPVSSVLRSL